MSSTCQFTRLFEPGNIGGLKLKNRIAMAPMGTRYFTEEGFASPRAVEYYSERARGGVGLIVVEGTFIFPDVSRVPLIMNDEHVRGLRKIVDAVHAEGVPILIQITPSRMLLEKSNTAEGLTYFVISGKQFRSNRLSTDEINWLVGEYGKATRRAMEAGFDGVEIHGGPGHLVADFLSPLTNRRTDKYGGDIGNRTRFASELLAEVRRMTRVDYPVVIRLSGDEKIKGGYGTAEAVAVCKLLEQRGVDAVDIVSGSIHSDEWVTPPMSMPSACNADLSGAIKKELKIPVLVAGKINDPSIAERILESRQADYVSIGRALIADPKFPIKSAGGKVQDICNCIGCLRCREAIAVSAPVACTVNPAAGREKDFTLKKASSRKHVLVVGGGPAGMLTSLLSSRRGHAVTLWEQGNRLGGQLNLACVPPGKKAIKDYLQYMNAQIQNSDIELILGKCADQAAILEHSPDAVIVATGSKAVIPRIQGMETTDAIVTAREVLSGEARVGNKVIVVGGGYIGCEVAEYLTDQGKQVIIVEMLNELLQDVFRRVRKVYLKQLDERHIVALTGIKSECITTSGMRVSTADGKQIDLDADTIVTAVGSSPDKTLFQALQYKVDELYEVGDCVKARTLFEAIQDGAEVALKI